MRNLWTTASEPVDNPADKRTSSVDNSDIPWTTSGPCRLWRPKWPPHPASREAQPVDNRHVV
jgi:hypothetical protein